jgi:uncharacterized protein YggE
MTLRHPAAGLLALVLLACAPARAQQPAPTPTPAPAPGAAAGQGVQSPFFAQLVTSGQGEAKIVPDRARLEVSVQTRAATAAAAGSENARKQQSVLDALKKLGFAADQLSTVNYNLYPEMQYDPKTQRSRVSGYTATNTVRVEIRDVGMIGRAIDASLEAGSNMISSLSFYASNTDAARRAALADAVARARDDADAIARAAGGSVGQLLEITTMDIRPPVIYNRVALADAAVGKVAQSTPVEPGEQTVTAMVTVRWAFVAGR